MAAVSPAYLPPPPEPEQNFWRVMLCDRYGAPLSDITSIVSGKKITEAKNQPTSFSAVIDDSSHKKVAKLHTDGAPYLEYIRRTVKVYRWEQTLNGDWGYVHRFAGYVWPLEDNADDTDVTTTLTCFDPLIVGSKRFVRDAAGSFMLVDFATTDDASFILKTIWDRTNTFAGDTGLVTDGNFEIVGPTSGVEWSVKLISEAMNELITGLDVWVEPVDTKTGALGRLHCFKSRGQVIDKLQLSWSAPPANLSGLTRTMDPTDACNVLVGVGSKTSGGDQLTTTAVDAGSIDEYMQLEAYASYSDVKDQAHLDKLVASDLYNRRPPQEAITCRPFGDVQPWRDFNVGDTGWVTAGPELRGGVGPRQERIYGFTLSIDEADDETLDVVTQQ